LPHYVTARESTCSDGRADWVWGGSRRALAGEGSSALSPFLQQPTLSRILALLKPVASRRAEFLQGLVGVDGATFRKAVNQLLAADLMEELAPKSYVLGSAFQVPALEISAFEFKLGDWKRAFYQAKRYRCFAHRVYVVMPIETAHRVEAWQDTFRRFNVGLIAHSPEGSSEVILPARRTEPSSRARYLRAIGMLLS